MDPTTIPQPRTAGFCTLHSVSSFCSFFVNFGGFSNPDSTFLDSATAVRIRSNASQSPASDPSIVLSDPVPVLVQPLQPTALVPPAGAWGSSLWLDRSETAQLIFGGTRLRTVTLNSTEQCSGSGGQAAAVEKTVALDSNELWIAYWTGFEAACSAAQPQIEVRYEPVRPTGDVPPPLSGSRLVSLSSGSSPGSVSVYLTGGYSCTEDNVMSRGGLGCFNQDVYVLTANLSSLVGWRWRRIAAQPEWPQPRAYHTAALFNGAIWKRPNPSFGCR